MSPVEPAQQRRQLHPPGRLVVSGPGDLHPADGRRGGFEDARHPLRIRHHVRPFGATQVEVDPSLRRQRPGLGPFVHHRREPVRGRQHTGQRKDIRSRVHRVVRHQSTHGTADDRGDGRARVGAIACIHPGFDHLDQEGQVGLALSLPVIGVRPRAELVHPLLAAIVDADRDELDAGFGGVGIQRLVEPPLAGIRGGVIKEVLPVVQVDHRIAPIGFGVTRWQVDPQPAIPVEAGHRQGLGDHQAHRIGHARRGQWAHGHSRQQHPGHHCHAPLRPALSTGCRMTRSGRKAHLPQVTIDGAATGACRPKLIKATSRGCAG